MKEELIKANAYPVPTAPTAVTLAEPMATTADSSYAVQYTSEPTGNFQPMFQPRRTRLHDFSRLLSLVTCGATLNIIAGQVWGMTVQHIPLEEEVVRGYIIAFAILIAVNETEFSSFFRESPVLHNWMSRGIFYSFLGFLSAAMNDIGNDNYYKTRMQRYSQYDNDNSAFTVLIPSQEQAAEAYIRFGSLFLFGIGLVYGVLGLLRVQVALKRQKEEYFQHSELWNKQFGDQPKGCFV